MKKFLKKKSVMLTFIILSIVMLALYVGMLVRPVAVGFNYTHKTDEVTTTYNFGFKKVTATMEGENSSTTREVYYYCQDGIVVFDSLGTVSNNDEYKEWKQTVKDNWGTYKKSGIEINSFKLGGDDTTTYKCVGTIVFAVVGGVVELVLITFAILSVLAKKKR